MLPRHFSLLSLAAIALTSTFALAQVKPAAPSLRSKESTVRVESAASPKEAADAAPSGLKTINQEQEAIIIERFITRARWEADGTGVRETTAVARVQSEAGVQSLAVLNFAYTTENDTVEVDYVRVRKADGTVVNTPSYNIQDMPADVTRVAPMYSDLHEKHITVKGLGVGDTLEYVVRFRTIKPQVPGHFWFEYSFQKDAVAKDEQLEIDVPADKYVKLVSPDAKPQVKEEGGRRIYSWKHSNLSRKEIDPREIPLRDAPPPSVRMTTFHSWEEVGKWYSELQRAQLEITPEIRAKAAEVTKGLTRDDEKIKALYKFVANRFHYISLSFGIGRYQPHAATDVLENEYGDCKDKHTLLAALLKASGYEAWPAAIQSTRKIDPDVPSPGQFDHVISVIPRGNSLLWLDTTPEVAPFGLLMVNLRDKQALVMPNGKPASLMNTPENPPFPSSQTFVTEGKLGSDGTFVGHIQRKSRGDLELILRLAFRATSQSQWKDLAQRLSYGAGFAGIVDAVSATKPEDTDVPFDLSYDYTRKEYGDWENRRITPPMPPMGIESSPPDQKKPEEPFLLGAPGDVVYRAKLELPAGYTAVAPKNVDLVQPYAEYHAAYAIEDGVLSAVRRLTIKQKEVPLSAWEDFKQFRKAVSDDENHFIALNDSTKKSDSNQGDSEADRKFREGFDAMQRNDSRAAAEAFRRVLEIDPKYKGAHFNLALTYLRQSEGPPQSFEQGRERAMEEALKELEVNPYQTQAYEFLTFLYGDKHPEKAIEQWRKLVALDPKNVKAVARLTKLLADTRRYDEAITVLVAAQKQIPDSSEVKSSLAHAYVKAGQSEKGITLLKDIVAKEPSPNNFNTLAYTMAEANVDLPQAMEYAEKAVRDFEAASVEAADSDRQLLAITREMGMAWDTLGWVYFHAGQLDKAVPYLRAAWELSQDGEGADHLGQAYERQGKKALAAHTYALAIAAQRSPNREDIRARYQRLTGRAPDVHSVHRGPDGKWIPSPAEELSTMRTVEFTAPAKKRTGSAVYSLMASAGKIEQVKFVSGDDSMKGLESLIAAAKIKLTFPDQNPAKMMRSGIVACTGTSCTLVLQQVWDTVVRD